MTETTKSSIDSRKYHEVREDSSPVTFSHGDESRGTGRNTDESFHQDLETPQPSEKTERRPILQVPHEKNVVEEEVEGTVVHPADDPPDNNQDDIISASTEDGAIAPETSEVTGGTEIKEEVTSENHVTHGKTEEIEPADDSRDDKDDSNPVPAGGVISPEQASEVAGGPEACNEVVTTRIDQEEESRDRKEDSPMLAVVEKFFEESQIRHQPVQHANDAVKLFTMNLKGNNSTYQTFVDIRQSDDRICVIVQCPLKVPEAERRAAAEYFARVNYTLSYGGFEMDFSDGEVRYRFAIDVEGGVLSVRMVKNMVLIPAATMDRFFPGLMAVVYGGKDIVRAYEDCRSSQNNNTRQVAEFQ